MSGWVTSPSTLSPLRPLTPSPPHLLVPNELKLITNQVTTIILAGGQSSRMGRDKALIEIDGVPLLRRVCEAALLCSDEIYVVTSRVEAYRSRVPSEAQFIAEIEPRGPAIAVAQALPHVSTPWILLLACDLPRLDGTQLQPWAASLDGVPDAAVALLPKHEKGWQPLCGFYRTNRLSALEQFIEQGGRSFQRWLSTQVIQELPCEPRILFNCNTPDELKSVLQTPG
ncbi:molybdenum cofactor guanylyltransferase [Myxacorys almedinensis]|uniref:Probable molybdenum cofactor guanylyltransferase n=1 Tax=Myxacorys almedinensis A TaxID=2690445 RepID=A0A8J7Z167_9CYAN|nr:molybdenum cofactor guanylyltransferase [Myxacorys almedinensis]NDJ17784.1 molybdenum cofactor guanylyltransferase [Myxacorys almedinensis A]